MIQISKKDHGTFTMWCAMMISLIGFPFEYSWQCGVCKRWEWGSIYRFMRAAYKEILLEKCIKHHENN